jgi:predicted HD superfamily hydrolase involved in NAD metabolism
MVPGLVMTEGQAEALAAARVSPGLLDHCHSVGRYAAELAQRWGASVDEAVLCGLLHDYCRELTAEQILDRCRELDVSVSALEEQRPVQLLHARLAATELRAQDLSADCLDAIARHTVGGAGMSVLAQCLYVADTAEPGRTYKGASELRSLAAESLRDALQAGVVRTLQHLVSRGRPIHPDTIALYNELAV